MDITEFNSSIYCQFSISELSKKMGENKLFHIELLTENMGDSDTLWLLLVPFFPFSPER